jgi:membrane-associated phospholipid phosphatase
MCPERRTSLSLSNPTLTVLLVASSAFVGLVVVALVGTLPFEAEVREALLGWAGPSVKPILRLVNRAGDWRLILPAGLVLVAMVPRARGHWWVWFALTVVTPLAVSATKDLVGRTRPEALSLGFPSGHATAAAVCFGTLCYMASVLPSRRARVALRVSAALIVMMVALTRVLLRAHWPSDVLGGVALGLALASAATLAAQLSQPQTSEERQ